MVPKLVRIGRLGHRMEPEDVYEELNQLCRRAGGKLSESNAILPWRSRRGPKDWPRYERASHGLELVLKNPRDRFDRCGVFRLSNKKLDCYANGVVFVVDIEDLNTSVMFSIPKPDAMHMSVSKLSVRGLPPVYVPERSLGEVEDWLSDAEVRACLNSLALKKGEYLTQVLNMTWACFVPRGLDADWARLELLVRLIGLLPEGKPKRQPKIDASTLPELLRPLVSLIREWALSDDAKREAKIQNASMNKLASLHTSVQPLLADIDTFIDSSGDRLPDEAMLLGDLAQAGIEAGLEIERRAKAAG